ncbi:hypothetical protein, partial [Klebsiella pneumoniae]
NCFLWGFDLCFYCASSSGVAFKQAVTLTYIACRRIAIFYFDMGCAEQCKLILKSIKLIY